MQSVISFKDEFEKIVSHFQDELKSIRTGRAHSSSVEHIPVECYGAITPLKGLASISIPDSRTILIAPWDTSLIKDIEKALVQSPLGINPMNEGTSIRIVLPQLTEENRRALAKTVGQKQEQTKVSLRLLRDKVREEISKAEKNNELTEDDRFSLQKELDDMTKEYTTKSDTSAREKEKEILTV